MHTVYLSIGSNIGDRKTHLSRAIEMIAHRIGSIVKESRIYETAAWGLEDQPVFYNQIVQIKSEQKPSEILSKINKIEEEIGRIRNSKWASRKIDIDILFYDDIILETEDLAIPHPYLQDRNFVLVPFLEINPEYHHPKLKQTIRELYFSCADNLSVFLNEISQ